MTAPTESRRILVVEDEDGYAHILCMHIERTSDYSTYTVTDGLQAVERILADDPLLVVLDLALPGIDGLEVCRRVRPDYTGPILFLTAEHNDQAQLESFRSGGDDYIVKPTSLDIVVARIDHLIRRAQAEPAGAPATPGVRKLADLEPVEVGDLTLDPIAQRVSAKTGAKVHLTPSEAHLLWLLGSRQGQLVSRDEMFRALKGRAWDGHDRLPDVYVSKLRKKLKKLPGRKVMIKAAQGMGYVLFVRQ